ncbi:hypothetical protein [Streptococcus sp. sy004]|uniref:hypothetical protein n=1 Tax=Streptococcus sp. sy004 TaxID=2600149 RepID=UPI0016473DE7|nr:hypothetical protein [Streptococcus sp. sy004]
MQMEEHVSSTYLYTFFEHHEDWTKPANLLIYQGDSPTNLNLYKTLSIVGRDPSITKKGETYYIAITDPSVDDKRDLTIYTTKDFETFNYFSIAAGLTNTNSPHVWAPDFFTDLSGQDWIIVSLNDRGQEANYEGTQELSFSPYIIPINLETMVAGQPQKLILEDKNYIDGHIFIKDDVYQLMIKDEKNKKLELWESQDLINWSKVYNQIPNTGRWIEGAFILQDEMTKDYTIYMDQYVGHEEQTPGMYYITTSDFETFSERQVLDTDQRLRHGFGICL